MTKHVADQTRHRGAARMTQFLRQERATMPHDSSLKLQARPQSRDGQRRKAAEYARIERGHQA